MGFAGAVTERALFGFVLPASVLGSATAVLFISNRQLRTAAGAGLAAGLVWAEIVNVVTGTSNGPAARSSFAAATLATLAMTAAASRFPAMFAVAVGGIIFAAVLLGAGGEVRIVATATVAVAVVALAIVEASARRWARLPGVAKPGRPWSVGAVAGLVVLAAVLAAVTQARHDPRSPRASVAGTANSLAKPPWHDPFPSTNVPPPPKRHPHKTHRRHHVVRPQHKPHHRSLLVLVLLAVYGLLLLAELALVLRLLWIQREWRRIRQSLRAPPANGVVGAWIWARLRLAAYRMPLPARLSPDLVDRGEVIHTVPPNTAEPLQSLARLASPVAFAGGPSAELDVANAWLLSDQACAAAEAALSWLGHLRLRLATPPLQRQ
jgi:hypothetical protein